MMTDEQLLRCLQDCQRRCRDGRQANIREALHRLDYETKGRCQDRQQRDALYEILNDLSRGRMRKLDEIIELLGAHLDKTSHGRRTAAIDFITDFDRQGQVLRDRSGITQAFALLQEQVLAPITKAEMAELTKSMNTTTPDPVATLEAQLAQAKIDKADREARAAAQAAALAAAEVVAAAAAERDAKLVYYIDLATATKNLLQAIRSNSAGPATLLAGHRFELKSLASEFGFRIVLVGDKTQAMLVQK